MSASEPWLEVLPIDDCLRLLRMSVVGRIAVVIDATAMTDDKIKLARQLYDAREHTVEQIAKALGVSRKTIYRYLAPR